jgi:hypothetical protein
VEIRANKRWLAKQHKALLARLSGTPPNRLLWPADQQWMFDSSRNLIQSELRAVENAIEAMRTPEGAAAFRKQLKQGIVIIGSVAGGTGSPTPPGFSVTAVPRKKSTAHPTETQATAPLPKPAGVYIPLGASGARVVEVFEELLAKKFAKKRPKKKRAVKKRAESRPPRKTGTRKQTPPKTR